MEINKNKRSGWEYFLIVFVVGLGMVLSMALYAKRDQVAKEKTMKLELLTLRNYVIAYTLEHRRHPQDLKSMPPLEIDSFGNPYHYNAKTGWVSSSTSGYESW